MNTYHITAIVNGRPGEITVQASCETTALEIAKASLPKKMCILNAQFDVTRMELDTDA